MTVVRLSVGFSADEVRGFIAEKLSGRKDIRFDSLDFAAGEATAVGAYRVCGSWVGLRAVLKPMIDVAVGRFGVRIVSLNLTAVPFVGLAFVASKVASCLLANVPFAEMDGKTVWLDAAKIAAEKCPDVTVAGKPSAFIVSPAGIEIALGERTVIYNRNDLKSSIVLDREPCSSMSRRKEKNDG